jgi:hypothetical protein
MPNITIPATQRAVSHPALPAAIWRPGHDTDVGHLESPLGVRPVSVLVPAVLSRVLVGLHVGPGRKPSDRLLERQAAGQH